MLIALLVNIERSDDCVTIFEGDRQVMKQFNLPDIAAGKVIPHSIQEKILKEEQEKLEHKKNKRQQFWHDVLIAIIGVVLSNADRIYLVISNLIQTLLNE